MKRHMSLRIKESKKSVARKKNDSNQHAPFGTKSTTLVESEDTDPIVVNAPKRKKTRERLKLGSKPAGTEKLIQKKTDDENCRDTSKNMISKGALEASRHELLFYSFVCQWQVSSSRGQNDKTTMLLCKRKFKELDASIDHLHNFHLDKLLHYRQPLTCFWKGCASKNIVCHTLEDLKEHVIGHARKTSALTDNAAGNTLRQESSCSTTPSATALASQRKSLYIVLPRCKSTQSPSSTVKDRASSSDSQTTKRGIGSISSAESDSWIFAALYALLSTRVKQFKCTSCPPSQLCLFCRFFFLKTNLARHNSLLHSMPDDTELRGRYKSCAGDPMKFIIQFLADVARHGVAYHGSSAFEENFWTKEIEKDCRKCTKHPLNGNLVNLFPVLYKNCNSCTMESMSWPSASQVNIIVHLGSLQRILCPDVLIIKGRVYCLRSVVCCDSDGSHYTYTKCKGTWVTFYEKYSVIATDVAVFGDKAAQIVVYCAKKSTSVSSTMRNEANLHKQCRSPAEKSIEPGLSSFGKKDRIDTVSPDVDQGYAEMKQDLANPKLELQRLELALPELNVMPSSPPKEDMPDLLPVFATRKLSNGGSESCINSVAQALLTTCLPTIVKDLCPSGRRCFFCRMLSFCQRTINNLSGTVLQAYELSMTKEVGITDGRRNVSAYITALVNKIVLDEKKNHKFCDTECKFMIQFKKMSCGCITDCEAYHWAISPTKKNESLFYLMAHCHMKCAECNVLTSVQFSRMPENLIIVIEGNDNHKDVSVCFPDEWTASNIRYFLSAIIVDDLPCGEESAHYYTYCKVFGRWMCYNDTVISESSSSDVLGHRRARVLIYVANELTPDGVRDAVQHAKKCLERIHSRSSIMVKTEKPDICCNLEQDAAAASSSGN